MTSRFIAPLFLMTVMKTRQNEALMDTLPTVPEQRYLKKRRQATEIAVILVLFSFVLFHTLYFISYYLEDVHVFLISYC